MAPLVFWGPSSHVSAAWPPRCGRSARRREPRNGWCGWHSSSPAAYCSGRSPWASGRTTCRSPTTHGPPSAIGWLWAGTRRPSAKCWRPTCSSRRSRSRHPRNGVTPCTSGRRSSRSSGLLRRLARQRGWRTGSSISFGGRSPNVSKRPAPSSSGCTRRPAPRQVGLFDEEAFKQSAAGTLFYGKELVAWIWPRARALDQSHESFEHEQPRRSPVSDISPTREPPLPTRRSFVWAGCLTHDAGAPALRRPPRPSSGSAASGRRPPRRGRRRCRSACSAPA